MVIPEPGRNPHHRAGLQPGGVDQELAKVAVVCPLELVLHDDDTAVRGLRLDVEPEVADRHLGRHQGERHAKFVGEDVEVLGEPGSEVAGL